MKQTFDLSELEPRDRYKLLSGLIVPRPIGWVGSRSAAGADNLAPFSFFNMVTGTPPTVLFAPGMAARLKDTLQNVRDTGCFTLSMVTRDLGAAMNLTAGNYPPEVDEFEFAGLAKAEGTAVPAPMVAEAKANLECRVVDIHEIGSGPAASVVYGEVLCAHVNEQLLDGTRIDLEELDAIGRLAGYWYTGVQDLFELVRPD